MRLLASDPEFVLHGSSGDPGSALAVITGENINVLSSTTSLGEKHSAEKYVAELRASGFQGKICSSRPDFLIETRSGSFAPVFPVSFTSSTLQKSFAAASGEVHEGKVLIEEHYLRKLVQVATRA